MDMSVKIAISMSLIVVLFVQIGSIQSQEPDQIWRRCGESGDWFGSRIANLGDINQDGINDFAANRITNHNRLEIFLGGNPPADTPSMIFSTPSPDSAYLRIIDNVGDVNGDSWDDVAILCMFGSCDQYAGSKLHIYHSGAKFDTIPDITLSGYTIGRFGYNLAGIGDVNNDGYDDIAVYTARGLESESKINVFFGGDPMDQTPDWELNTLENVFNLGRTIVGNMDLNNDGIGDFALYGCHKQDDGELYSTYFVFWGGSQLDSLPGLVIEADSPTTNFSALEGDFNGDSYSDLVAFADINGGLLVYFGSKIMDTQSDLVLERPTTNAVDRTIWVKAVGDVNKDGCDDIIAGFQGRMDYMGQILVYLGGHNMDGIPDLQWKNFMRIGKDLTFCADITGDGIDDIVFGDGQKKGCVGIWAGSESITDKRGHKK
jgi:hypothetical protein